ncbi:hypothetical protein [Frateuria aurantia]|uniref:Uncharacterized protein n=1 Tax=Frateuria aurantia (strain ATCC 33424 / DSM 6220 / KCTC 2777 / LMG 1558 / NBRC 3245 / NCIMB 13370) TaxID=767434 RepID=H8L2M6_FRAAD|nr:hypothetical protein [Frateuria aurantia]AFC85493.1 hypothetical protein Fraau_1032 [Frateuria aurantia DSM 6220]
MAPTLQSTPDIIEACSIKIALHEKVDPISKSGEHVRELLAALARYVLRLIIANGLEHALLPGSPLKRAIKLIPILGIPAVVWVRLHQLWRTHKLQRCIQLDGIAIA